MQTRRIVTEQSGSWKWQRAYRIATYEIVALKSGKLVWRSAHRSGKMSMPQVRRAGLGHLPMYPLHNSAYTWSP